MSSVQQNVLMLYFIKIDTNLFACRLFLFFIKNIFCSLILLSILCIPDLFYIVGHGMFYTYNCFLQIILSNLFRIFDYFFFFSFVFYVHLYLFYPTAKICSKLCHEYLSVSVLYCLMRKLMLVDSQAQKRVQCLATVDFLLKYVIYNISIIKKFC